MIISSRQRFAFIHNPKVGGTSVRKALEHHHDYPQTFWHQGWDNNTQRVQDRAHIPRDDLSNRLQETLNARSMFVFGFVRDPMQRFWSSLAEFRRQHSDWFPSQMGTNAFINTFLTEANARHDWRFVHFCPQHYFFYEAGVPATDFIGRHETFAEDWKYVVERLGFDVPELNNERHRVKGENEELGPDAMQTLNRLYSRDCELFNYPPILDRRDVTAATHEHRVEQIHNPRLSTSPELAANLTAGERIAYDQVQLSNF